MSDDKKTDSDKEAAELVASIARAPKNSEVTLNGVDLPGVRRATIDCDAEDGPTVLRLECIVGEAFGGGSVRFEQKDEE